MCKFGDEEPFEFLVSTSADKGSYKGATRGTSDDGGEEIHIEVSFNDAEMVVAGMGDEYVYALGDKL